MRECIAIAASEAWITHIVQNGWETVGIMPLSTELYDIPSDWADIPSLRTYMLGKQAYKQKTKQESCVDMLLRDPQCAEHGPCTMIRKGNIINIFYTYQHLQLFIYAVVHQIYMQHFNPLSLVAERMETSSIGIATTITIINILNTNTSTSQYDRNERFLCRYLEMLHCTN